VRFRCCPYRPLCCQIKCLFQVALDAADRGLVEAGGLPLFGDEGLIGGNGEPQRPGEVLLLGPRLRRGPSRASAIRSWNPMGRSAAQTHGIAPGPGPVAAGEVEEAMQVEGDAGQFSM
jgi:hypothetical protein